MIYYVRMFLFVYLVIINIIAFATMGIDKRRAKKNKFRIPGKRLFFQAIIGGSGGTLMGMYHFRHKTKHREFVVGIPIIFFLQLIILIVAAQLTK